MDYSKINDKSYPYKSEFPENTYLNYCWDKYSQNGEDGIIHQLLKELNIKEGYCCEFGAFDGVVSSNTLELIEEKTFISLQIEGDPYRFELLRRNMSRYPNVYVENCFISVEANKENSLDTLLKKYNFPKDFDVLSIDIDRDDYFVWKNFTNYRPKIVIIETNSYRDPIVEETPEKKGYVDQLDILEKWCPLRIQMGSSFMSILKLGLDKGYIPVAYTGNITFLASEYVDKIKEFPIIRSNDLMDYLKLYTTISLQNKEWKTNTGLIMNVAIRNYFLKFKRSELDWDWIWEEFNTKKELIWKTTD